MYFVCILKFITSKHSHQERRVVSWAESSPPESAPPSHHSWNTDYHDQHCSPKKIKLKLQSVPVCCAAHCGRLCSVEAHFIPSGHWPGQWRCGQCWVEAHCTVAHDTNACHPLMSCSLLSGDTLTSDHILIYVFVFTVYLIFMNVTVYHLKAEHSP